MKSWRSREGAVEKLVEPRRRMFGEPRRLKDPRRAGRRRPVGQRVASGVCRDAYEKILEASRDAWEIQAGRRKELKEPEEVAAARAAASRCANGGRRSTEEEAPRAEAFWSSSQQEEEGPCCPLAKLGRCSSSCRPREMGEIPKCGGRCFPGSFSKLWSAGSCQTPVNWSRGTEVST